MNMELQGRVSFTGTIMPVYFTRYALRWAHRVAFRQHLLVTNCPTHPDKIPVSGGPRGA